ncbi:hypothetical protein [Flavobacterium nackdongense]|uniref:hypothetical protein n=1 Tax=Flavobacterium nackdongense TaxID=2547394 RepID=UPI0013FCFC77|nr:hypothetical protein [Flavobacterium nackdongense]
MKFYIAYSLFFTVNLKVSDLEKAEINKFRNTIDYKLGAAILNPLRKIKWFFLKLLQ